MLFLMLVLAIIILVIFIRLHIRYSTQTAFFFSISCMFGTVAILLLIPILLLVSQLSEESVLDEKIAIYQEENVAIEQHIDKLIKNQPEYDKDLFSDLNSISLVPLFSELKSDPFIHQQLDAYASNCTVLQTLKKEKTNMSKIKWLLYFGK